MILSPDTNDQLLFVGSIRYCLGRQTYMNAIGATAVVSHWSQLTESNRRIILRDIIEALMDHRAGSVAIDEPGWKAAAEAG